jgi:phosphatidylglycerophosphate synthase
MTQFTNFLLVSGIMGPTFILGILYFIASLKDTKDKFQKNLERRKKRKGDANKRITFDSSGRVVQEELHRNERLEKLLNLLEDLRGLVDTSKFGSASLFKHHPKLAETAAVADRCAEAAWTFLAQEPKSLEPLSTLDDVETLCSQLNSRVEPSTDVKIVLDSFQNQMAVLYAVFGENKSTRSADIRKAICAGLMGPENATKALDASHTGTIPDLEKKVTKLQKDFPSEKAKQAPDMGAQSLEPTDLPEGIRIRGSGLLFWAVELRDKYQVGSKRQFLLLVTFLCAIGPLRFLGVAAVLALGVLLVFELIIEVLRASDEKDGFTGFSTFVRRNMGRFMMPIGLMVFIGLMLFFGFFQRPKNNTDLNASPIFIEAPPWYNLNLGRGQTIYVNAIYAVMHPMLAIVLLIPLPLCYHTQASVSAQRFG